MNELSRQTKDSRPVRDLTGLVARQHRYSFACGGHAEIFKGEYLGCPVAVKVLKGVQDPETFHRRFHREFSVWSEIDHPNLLPLLGICYDFDQPSIPCLVSPYYRNGSITNFLKNRPNINKLPMLINVASALLYLHSLSIIHNDVKASNILIDDSGEACLSDYGISRILGRSGFTTKTQSATWRSTAPERFHEDEVISRATTATDVWSFAMTVIEIFTGSIPFSHIQNDASVILSVTSGGRPKREHSPQINDEIWAMLERCWDANPTLRPSMGILSQFFTSQVTTVVVERPR